MTALIIYGGIGVRWRISQKLRAKYYLKSIPGLFILNPLEYEAIYKHHGFIDFEHNFTFKDESFFETTGIVFQKTQDYELKIEEAWDKVSELFKYVKIYSLQYDLNYKHFHSFSDADTLTKSKVVPVEVPEFGMHEYRYKTFLMWNDFIKIDRIKARGEQMPVHREIFLDAVSAHFENDYRKSILYFCIACETKLSERLFNRYEELKQKKRLLHTILDSGQTKDPVYEILRKDKWQFRHKLHEQHIYLFGRSLLVENKTLYDSLLKLYNTRNKIAHEGEIKIPTKDLLTINEIGSEKAFDLSIELFSWLKDTSFQIFSSRKFVIVK